MNAFPSPHPEEQHKSHRSPWLRAAMLGANDGIVSTSSLMLGVLAASAGNPNAVLTAGIAGLVAGALSMAVGEYVSVSSQRDSELSDIEIEKKSLKENPKEELEELAWIYEKRGLTKDLARQVAEQLHHHSALEAHTRTELGISHSNRANPWQAAFASAFSFAVGALIPIFAALVSNAETGLYIISTISLIALSFSGAIAAWVGGGNKPKAALRVFAGGVLAMVVTYAIGHLVGAAV